MIAVTLICTYPIQLDAAYNYIANALEINKKTWIQYVLIIPGLVPFCTKSYGKWYWKAVVGALAFGIGILLFVGGTIKNVVTWIDLAYSRNKAT
uniref:Uncharacterized protein n=1 Tax=Glossina palpalis gambiensis TaxID=67801 RepID=A0A1B0B1P2_9MUSC